MSPVVSIDAKDGSILYEVSPSEFTCTISSNHELAPEVRVYVALNIIELNFTEQCSAK